MPTNYNRKKYFSLNEKYNDIWFDFLNFLDTTIE